MNEFLYLIRNRKFLSFFYFPKEIIQGDVFEGYVRSSDDGDLNKQFIRESNQTQIFSNDGPNKVVLEIDTGEDFI